MLLETPLKLQNCLKIMTQWFEKDIMCEVKLDLTIYFMNN